jgi:AcrR family transcriptional regulator
VARALRSDAVRNRQRLLAAASEAFADAGIGAPIEFIAARAGVSIGTLYNHFRDRDHLIDAVLDAPLDRLRAVADAAAHRRRARRIQHGDRHRERHRAAGGGARQRTDLDRQPR